MESLPKIHVLDTEDRWRAGSEDEPLWWPRTLWIDPGGTSGVAVVWFDPKALFAGATTAKVVLAYSELFLNGPEDGPNGQVNRFLRLRRGLATEPGLTVGCESFVIRRPDQSEEFLSPVRIKAAISNRLSVTRDEVTKTMGVHLFDQSPADAKTTFTNERLKNLRMYTPGPDHINDAKRHCLLWIRQMKLPNRGLEFFKQTHGYEEGWFE